MSSTEDPGLGEDATELPADPLASIGRLLKAREYSRAAAIAERALAFGAADAVASEELSRAFHVAKAEGVLADGKASLDDPTTLVRELIEAREYRLAGRVLKRAGAAAGVDEQTRVELARLRVAATYLDPNLPARRKLDVAFGLLGDAVGAPAGERGEGLRARLEGCGDTETLEMAGDIEALRWRLDHNVRRLHQALAYYRLGYACAVAGDAGAQRVGLRAAFILDQLATDIRSDDGARRSWRDEADNIRREVAARLRLQAPAPGDVAGRVSLAEALFGLGEFAAGADALWDAEVPPSRWEEILRGLARVVVMRDDQKALGALRAFASVGAPAGPIAGAWDALGTLVRRASGRPEQDPEPALRSLFRGKMGLALSGGGFRASIFHLGVLARLADLDLLRHVEVISGVSGGSIVGAHLYLKLQHLLQTRRDETLGRGDYVTLVQELSDEFLAGVQTNLRMQSVASAGVNVRAALLDRWSIARHLGDLYEKQLYARVADGRGGAPRTLDQLFIRPAGWEGDARFRPVEHNWHRDHKVPVIVFNAATLNTGHNWQFTAAWMGEPADFIDVETDATERLRTARYTQLPEEHRTVRLGYAVVASAAVPGVFEPLSLANLYPGKTVRLIDGGVHDNQGIDSLLDRDCTVVLVSDASGQISSVDDPSKAKLSVLMRSDEILQARVRAAQVHGLLAMRDAGRLDGLMVVHLKSDLPIEAVDWDACETPVQPGELDAVMGDPRATHTHYGVRVDVQRALAALRTDLDSFSDVEAFTLMTCGYKMAAYQLRAEYPGARLPHDPADGPLPVPPIWRFQVAETLACAHDAAAPGFERFRGVLVNGSGTLGRWWSASGEARRRALVLGGALLACLVSLAWRLRAWTLPAVSVGHLATLLVVVAGWQAVARVPRLSRRIRALQSPVTGAGWGLVLVLFGLVWAVGARLFLESIEPLALRAGRMPPRSGDPSSPESPPRHGPA